MNRILFFGLFLFVFLSVYGLLNAYVLRRFSTLFSLPHGWPLLGAIALGTLSYLFATVLLRLADNAFTNGAYLVAAVWMGAVFLAACVLLLHELARRLVMLPDAQWGLIALALTLLLVVVGLVSAAVVRTDTVTITDPRVPQELRLLHVSDLHLGPILGEAHLAKVVAEIARQKPDAVVITGDLIDGPGSYADDLLVPLDTLGVPIYFVTGNHEAYAQAGTIERLLEQTQIRYLKNEATAFGGVALLGIDDNDDARVVAERLAALPRDPAAYTVLLYHRPSAKRVVTGVDLLLSGHTHGGQLMPFSLVVALSERPVSGLHRYGPLTVHVSTGAGTWGPPMRLGMTGKMTMVALRPM